VRTGEISRLPDARRSKQPVADAVAEQLGPRPLGAHVEQRPGERRAQTCLPGVGAQPVTHHGVYHQLRLKQRRAEYEQRKRDRQRGTRVGGDPAREPREDGEHVGDAEQPADGEHSAQ
jgi:hypothetical protein